MCQRMWLKWRSIEEYVYTSSSHICSLVRHLSVEGDRITIT